MDESFLSRIKYICEKLWEHETLSDTSIVTYDVLHHKLGFFTKKSIPIYAKQLYSGTETSGYSFFAQEIEKKLVEQPKSDWKLKSLLTYDVRRVMFINVKGSPRCLGAAAQSKFVIKF